MHVVLDAAIETGELPPDVDKALLIDALLAIYTHGLRPAVFKDATPAECVELMLQRMEPLVRGVGAA